MCVPIVFKFKDIFLIDQLGMYLSKDIDFYIDSEGRRLD